MLPNRNVTQVTEYCNFRLAYNVMKNQRILLAKVCFSSLHYGNNVIFNYSRLHRV